MKRQADGATLQQHYESAMELTGVAPEGLDGPPLPPAAEHVYRWFGELSSARGSSGFAPAVIGYLDIAAWASLTGQQPTPWEVECLRALDALFLKIHAPAPGGNKNGKKS
jgi:hypothetical protein